MSEKTLAQRCVMREIVNQCESNNIEYFFNNGDRSITVQLNPNNMIHFCGNLIEWLKSYSDLTDPLDKIEAIKFVTTFTPIKISNKFISLKWS